MDAEAGQPTLTVSDVQRLLGITGYDRELAALLEQHRCLVCGQPLFPEEHA